MASIVSCIAVNRCDPMAAIAGNRAFKRMIGAARLLLLAIVTLSGCGTTKLQNATEQLVLSDAVDRSIAQIDFRPLSGRRVYFDTTYLKIVKNDSFVNADYVTSAMRQQIIAAGCLMVETQNDAELVIEGRIGTLGMDDHRLTYGVPESNALASTASLISAAPTIPSIPEIAFARRESREGAAKVAAFAYDRETRQAVWQSGLIRANSTARDTWVLGVGPFRQGTIRRELKFADGRIFNFRKKPVPRVILREGLPPVDYSSEMVFESGSPSETIEFLGPALADVNGEGNSSDNATQIAEQPTVTQKN